MAVLAAAGGTPAFGQSADELLSKGREAYMNYDFDEASRLYSQAKRKAKKGDEAFADTYATYHRQLTDAGNFLERIEKIAIIDSITVPRKEFFRHYRLPSSAGSLSGAEGLPSRRKDGVDYVFTNEGGDYKLWSQPDTTGYMHPVESILMTDGKWSEPAPIWEDLSEESDAIYPFMMSDGVTLYYADNGENSIGGYDIMVATRDAADGKFLQPSNLGFPYNSPYDDYLLAIDELNGVGWWATDRNLLDDELTVYVFVTNELRENYPADSGNLADFARISDYVATQPEDADYDELLATLRAIDTETRARKPEFTFAASKGRIYHHYDELPNMAARGAMRKYMSALADYESSLATLAKMRRDYHEAASVSKGERIAAAERKTEEQRANVARLLKDVHKALAN